MLVVGCVFCVVGRMSSFMHSIVTTLTLKIQKKTKATAVRRWLNKLFVPALLSHDEMSS